MSAVSPCLEVVDAILDVGGDSLNICMQCGTCTAVCPWGLVKSFSPRNVVRMLSFGLEGVEDEALWNCVTCNTCVSRCPREVDMIDVVRSARTVMVEMGSLPPSFKGPLGCLRSDGNPWSGDRDERAAWQEGLDVPTFSAETEWLLFTCCTQAYDVRNKRVAKALVELLKKAEISFGSLKEKESCCGDSASKAGDSEVFARLESANTSLFQEHEVGKMVVGSPHCLNAFSKDYETLRGGPRVVHHTVLFAKLIEEGVLAPSHEVSKRVTYHDPCYLGRHNGIYEEPRAALAAIPGLTLLEMPRNREEALCCGGGGGGIWREVPTAERFAVLRVKEALATGAEIIATACPYCTIMFEDAIRVLDAEDEICVRDVSELLAESVREDTQK
jgi:Fe-S oxidoreductase